MPLYPSPWRCRTQAHWTQYIYAQSQPVLWSGSGSTWIRIHLAVLDPYPDLYWECGSGSRSSSMEIDQNLQINLVFRFCTLHVYVFGPILPTLSTFSCKNSTFCDLKVWPGPGSGSGSAWIRIGLNSWNRIRIRIETKKKLDPDPHWSQCRSTILILNTSK